MKTRSSVKRNSPPTKGNANNAQRVSSNVLKSKRQKLETKPEYNNDTTVQENVSKSASVQNQDQSSDSSSEEFMQPSPLGLSEIVTDRDSMPMKRETDFTSIEDNILIGVTRLSDSEDSDLGDPVVEMKSEHIVPITVVKDAPTSHVSQSERTDKRRKASDQKPSRRKRTIKSRQNVNVKTSTENIKVENDVEMKILPAVEVNKMDVSELLALGEGSDSNVIPKIHKSAVSSEHDLTSDSENELSDWEDVGGLDLKREKHVIPKEGIEVTLEVPDLYRKRKKKGFDMEAYLRRRVNRVKREVQVLVHKVHLLVWIAHGRCVNSVLNSEVLMGISLSLIPSQHCYPSKHTDLNYLEKIVEWFRKTVSIKETEEAQLSLCESLQQQLQSRIANSARDLVLMFICTLRALGVKARLMMSLQPLPLKASSDDLCTVTKATKKGRKESTNGRDKEKQNKKEVTEKNVKKPAAKSKTEGKVLKKDNQSNDNISDEKMEKLKLTLRARKEVTNRYKDSSDEETRVACHKVGSSGHKPGDNIVSVSRPSSETQEKSSSKGKSRKNNKSSKGKESSATSSVKQETIYDDSDSDFVPEPFLKRKHKRSAKETNTTESESNSESDFEPKKLTQRKKSVDEVLDRRVLSSDSGSSADAKNKKKKVGIDVWTEVFLEEEEKWISVDVPKGNVHCVTELCKRATQPVTYVLAFNNDLTLKDVTCRYCAQFTTVTRKLRVNEEWWKQALRPFLTARTAHDREEDEELNRLMLDRPMPTTIKEFKNHPLYVLRDDLLKFEAIYPPNAPPLGFVRGKPIFARECVHTLHSREIWMKEAKVVRLGETPYKIVKARPKYDKMTGQFVKDLPLEVFGSWQVEDYIPPPAVDGKVPRNEYGNVELYKACMLPTGTVHLQVPGLNRVARKLGIDCAPAVVGFDFHCGGSHPMFDGFVVCEEHKDALLDAWNQEQDEAEKRQQEKLEKRVYGNWRRLIKGLLIRERLKLRYSFGEEAGSSGPKKLICRKQPSKPVTSNGNPRKQTGSKPVATSSNQKGKQRVVRKRRKVESEEDETDDSEEEEVYSDQDWD